jgi:hypothetical protein
MTIDLFAHQNSSELSYSFLQLLNLLIFIPHLNQILSFDTFIIFLASVHDDHSTLKNTIVLREASNDFLRLRIQSLSRVLLPIVLLYIQIEISKWSSKRVRRQGT